MDKNNDKTFNDKFDYVNKSDFNFQHKQNNVLSFKIFEQVFHCLCVQTNKKIANKILN